MLFHCTTHNFLLSLLNSLPEPPAAAAAAAAAACAAENDDRLENAEFWFAAAVSRFIPGPPPNPRPAPGAPPPPLCCRWLAPTTPLPPGDDTPGKPVKLLTPAEVAAPPALAGLGARPPKPPPDIAELVLR